MADVQITVTRNGSYHIQGQVKMVDYQGNEIPVDSDEVWLCRCGASASKPFCDGSHRKIGFKDSIARQVQQEGDAAVEGDPEP